MRKLAALGVIAVVLGTAFLDEYYGGWWWLVRWPVLIAALYLWATWLNKRRAARNPPTDTGPESR